jgi:hypothetical protein
MASINDDSRLAIKLEEGQPLKAMMDIPTIWKDQPPRGILNVILSRPPDGEYE